MPTGILGLIVYKPVKHYLLYNDKITVISLIIGGIIIIAVELSKKKPTINSIDQLSVKKSHFTWLYPSTCIYTGRFTIWCYNCRWDTAWYG